MEEVHFTGEFIKLGQALNLYITEPNQKRKYSPEMLN